MSFNARLPDRPEEPIGVLLVNSGSPDSLDIAGVRDFLRRLLSDRRVIEAPRALWLPILHGIILRTRPRAVVRKYRDIWTPQGSPLLVHSRELRTQLARELALHTLAPFHVEIAMLYSRPSVKESLARLCDAGVQKILVLPLFPQYSGATTAAVFDQVSAELNAMRLIPELRFISDYSTHPQYIEALAASVREQWQRRGRTSHLLMSFHGIPEQYATQGDPYCFRAHGTARRLAAELGLREGEWSVSFQSRFGPAEWLKPYTSDVIAGLPKRGVNEVTVICPGFAIDCLESLEEIDVENRALFESAGGRAFHYVPALNARADHTVLLRHIIVQHCQGWLAAERIEHAAHPEYRSRCVNELLTACTAAA
jgi:protoporphyrin/coproporphyrin ferrochelatase